MVRSKDELHVLTNGRKTFEFYIRSFDHRGNNGEHATIERRENNEPTGIYTGLNWDQAREWYANLLKCGYKPAK